MDSGPKGQFHATRQVSHTQISIEAQKRSKLREQISTHAAQAANPQVQIGRENNERSHETAQIQLPKPTYHHIFLKSINQSRSKIPSSPTLAINSTLLFFTLHSPLAPARGTAFSPSPSGSTPAPSEANGSSTSSSMYFPYAVQVCPSHLPLPKCTPEK